MLNDYFTAIAGLAERVNLNWLIIAGVFTRMSGIAFLAPAMGELTVSPRVRLAAAAALTMVVAPSLWTPAPADVDAAVLAVFLAAEAAAGLLVGFALRLALFALQMLGSITAQALSLTQLFGPGLGHDQESPFSTILIAAGLAVACAGGLHLEVAATAVATYEVLPLGEFVAFDNGAEFAAVQSAKAISLAFGLAAPFVLLGFAYSIALAASNRAMPQMAAVFVGAPAIVLAGMILFAGSAYIILSKWSGVMAALASAPLSGLP